MVAVSIRIDVSVLRACFLCHAVVAGPFQNNGLQSRKSGSDIAAIVPHDTVRGDSVVATVPSRQRALQSCVHAVMTRIEVVKPGKLSEVVVEFLAIGEDVFSHREQVVYVGAKRRPSIMYCAAHRLMLSCRPLKKIERIAFDRTRTGTDSRRG